MNILFVNYGDFTTNSLNHIGGFANALCAAGHACVVVVPQGKETSAHVHHPLFIPATYAEALARPGLFPDGRPAELIHAWTPREGVRKFVLAYQRAIPNPARVIVHLEDNERFLLEAFAGKPFAELQAAPADEIEAWLVDGLPHPLRHESFLRTADGVTHIIERLREFAPAQTPAHLLFPGVDFGLYHPQPPDAKFRAELGLQPEEKVLVFTGSSTFANEAEMRELYLAVALLNERGIRTRLVRTGFNSPTLIAGLPATVKQHVLDLGFVEKAKLPKLLALADILVQPGRAGAFNDYRLPSKLPEFLAMGKAVALPPTNLALLMRDGVEAVFLPTGSPAEIADACARLFANPALAAQLGRKAEAFAREHFDLAANSRRLAEFYQATLQRAPLADWRLARTPGATETALVMARIRGRLPGGAEPEVELLGRLAAHLDQAVERARTQPDSALQRLNARLEALQGHAGELQRTLDDTRRLDAQHIGNLEQKLALTTQHAANLNREIVDARGRLKRLEEKYAISEKLLGSTRQQLETLDRDLGTERQRAAQREELLRLTQQHVTQRDELLRLTQQHATNLDQLRRVLQQRVRELDAQCQHLENTIAARDAVVAQREAKIRKMQRSFSWQVTSPLRWLRRTFFDRAKPRPSAVTAPAAAPAVTATPPGSSPEATLDFPAAPALRDPSAPVIVAAAPASAPDPTVPMVMSVDNPQSWSLPPRKHTLRGWCFADDGRKLTAMRAVLPGRTVEGVYGFKRLDVFAAVRSKPQAEHCGWKIEVELSPADQLLDLEVADEAGVWHRFFHTALRIGEGLGPLDLTSYERWAEVYDTPTPAALLAQAAEAQALRHQPLISIVMPVYNTPEQWLRRAVDSVRAQTYAKWELCLADDASPAPHVRPLLEAFAREDARIKVAFRAKNGHISASSNSALELATGEFIALLDHDDELAPHALYEVAAVLNARPDADYIYSDEDKIDEDGRRFEPYFKPDWQPDLFIGQNYTSHLSVYRAALVRAVGGFRVGYEGSQDWDLALRVIEKTSAERIVHIPKILYHWRAIAGSTALQLSEKNYPVEAARKALADHLARRGIPGELAPVPGDHWRVKWPVPTPAPLVSLVIPTRNGLLFLRRCVDSILAKTAYTNYEVIVVDNGSDDPATLAYLATLAEGTHPLLRPGHAARVLRYDAPFNYSAINNHAVGHARGSLVGLLNNDLEVINADWLTEMVAQAVRPEIGCVGAMLYYPNDTIQHAGVVLGVGGVAGHAFREFPRGTEGKFNRARLAQNYSAVTAACLLVRKAVYEQVGGLDEQTLAVAFNDIDFCLKVRAAGYRNLWTPFAELYHHESASRGADDTPEKAERFQKEVEAMLRRWGPLLQRDPAYNPNLTLEHNDFTLASPPRPALVA